MTRMYAVTVGCGLPISAETLTLARPARIAETGRVGIALHPEAGIRILQSRRPRTGGVVLDRADLSDEALAILRAFVAVA